VDVIFSTLVYTNILMIKKTLYKLRTFHKPEIVHYRTEDSRWKRKRGHQGPSLEATNMMVELSQCHADKRWGRLSLFSSRANPMKLIDPTRLDLLQQL